MNTQTLERGTITVQHIFPAKGPGKSAWIKDVDGMMFGFKPDKTPNIQQGEAYEIEFTENVKNGTTYRDIVAARAAAPPKPASSQFTASAPAAPKPAPQNGNGGGNQYYRPTAPKDSERMFVCSTLNAFIQTGRIDAHRDHLTAVINELRAAYAATFGKDDPS